ncbi:MAG: DUF1565 domain-containing protein [Massilia sp.]
MIKRFISLLLAALCASSCGGGSAPAPVAVPAPAPSQPDVEEAASVLSHPDQEPVAETMQRGDGSPAAFALGGYGVPANLAALAVTDDDAAPSLAALAAPAARNLYVAPGGADSNPGTAEAPLRSLWRAAKLATPGTKVFVAPGTYEGGFRTSTSGTAGARIVYLSTVKWGAKIVPPRDAPNKVAWDNRASHVDIVGFEIDGRAYAGGQRWSHGIYSAGSYASIRNNHIHDIAQHSSCTSAGGAAIGVDSYYHGVYADVIANLVHDIGPAGCRYVQGIYVSTSARVKNNVVYRVAEGGIHLWHDARHVYISNNTVSDSDTGIIVGGGNFYFATGPNDYTEVYSNIVVNNRMGISEQGQTGLNNHYHNNLVYQNSRYNWALRNGLTPVATVSAPPRFVSGVDTAAPLLRPALGSPAIGMGSAAFAETTDFDGRPRNREAGYDIGAYQH